MKSASGVIFVWCLIPFVAMPQAYALAPESEIQEPREAEVERLRSELSAKFENGTPEELKALGVGDVDNPYAKLFKLNEEAGAWELVITREDVQNWGLEKWAEKYRKMAPKATAGIRDQQNILYPYDPRYPINLLGVVLTAVAKAEMLEAKVTKPSGEMLVGGDVRYNTEKYMDLVSRVYAAKGIRVHTPLKGKKTTIWMSSFLIAMRELDAGDYVTASHSNRDISATKLLSKEGSQLLIEEMVELTNR